MRTYVCLNVRYWYCAEHEHTRGWRPLEHQRRTHVRHQIA